MGTTAKDTWFDSKGESSFWKNIPLRTVKKAFFRKGDTVRVLLRMVAKGITYNFKETAQGGAVIVPPDYSAIELISPDGRIDYKTLMNGTLGDVIAECINVLIAEPVAAWDKFSAWLGENSTVKEWTNAATKCELLTIDGTVSVDIDIPEFTGITSAAALLERIQTFISPANGQAASIYQLDTASFGLAVKLIVEDGTAFPPNLHMGFIFRE